MLIGLTKPTFDACVFAGVLMVNMNDELQHYPAAPVQCTDDLTSPGRRCGD